MKRAIWGICITGFMAVIIGVVGMFSIWVIADHNYASYQDSTLALPSIAKLMEYTQRLRAIPYMTFYDTDISSFYERECAYSLDNFEVYMNNFQVHIITSEVASAFYEMETVYFDEYKPQLLEMLEYLQHSENRDMLPYYLDLMKTSTNTMSESAGYCMEMVAQNAYMERDASDYTARSLAVIMAVLIILEIALTVIFIVLVARYKGSQSTWSKNAQTKGMPPVYAMYPVDPLNPANPPNATHIIYPVIYPNDPSKTD